MLVHFVDPAARRSAPSAHPEQRTMLQLAQWVRCHPPAAASSHGSQRGSAETSFPAAHTAHLPQVHPYQALVHPALMLMAAALAVINANHPQWLRCVVLENAAPVQALVVHHWPAWGWHGSGAHGADPLCCELRYVVPASSRDHARTSRIRLLLFQVFDMLYHS